MSETPGRGRPVPRRAGEPRGGYDPPGREPRDRGPYDREHDREGGPERDADREARAHDQPPERSSERSSDRHGPRRSQGSRGAETRRDGETRDQETRGRGADAQGAQGVQGAQGAQGVQDVQGIQEGQNGQIGQEGARSAQGASDATDGLQGRVLELQALVTDLQDRWRRALADLDNLRKRVSRDAERTRSDERARAAGEWLPVLDNLDRALEHAETDPGSIVDGMRAIRDQAQEVLSRLGYARRDDTGAVFDPARHEAVGVLAREGVPDGTVLQVLRPGYGDGEQQLRPALVVVAKGA
ncbi:nucleotide exchange factor GrpE [Streptosporangium sp. V21-05]|uniref:nucleotide exchange factor GrpE n=1 Tax=Streptosporangium sp. V21-05 TaxID=3446115 RepID=UPI003F537814